MSCCLVQLTPLIWKLTNGKIHATDATNASRTMLFNITSNKWDKDILKIFKLNEKILQLLKILLMILVLQARKLLDKIKISAVLGDQQAAAIVTCFEKDQSKVPMVQEPSY